MRFVVTGAEGPVVKVVDCRAPFEIGVCGFGGGEEGYEGVEESC